jgi:excisionase family DNA binding protein
MTDDNDTILDQPGGDYSIYEKGFNAEDALPLVMNAQEVANLLRVSYRVIITMAKENAIPAFMVAGQWRFSRAAILKWIDDISNELYDPVMRTI